MNLHVQVPVTERESGRKLTSFYIFCCLEVWHCLPSFHTHEHSGFFTPVRMTWKEKVFEWTQITKKMAKTSPLSQNTIISARLVQLGCFRSKASDWNSICIVMFLKVSAFVFLVQIFRWHPSAARLTVYKEDSFVLFGMAPTLIAK